MSCCFFFCLLALDGKSLNHIPLLHFCNKKLNDDFKINLHMTDFSMASPPELHEIVFPENYVIQNSSTRSKLVSQQWKSKINYQVPELKLANTNRMIGFYGGCNNLFNHECSVSIFTKMGMNEYCTVNSPLICDFVECGISMGLGFWPCNFQGKTKGCHKISQDFQEWKLVFFEIFKGKVANLKTYKL